MSEAMRVACRCGAVEIEISGEPVALSPEGEKRVAREHPAAISSWMSRVSDAVSSIRIAESLRTKGAYFLLFFQNL
jgi:hypothetical protein